MRNPAPWLFRAAAVLAACCLLAACDKSPSTEELIVSGQQYIEKGDYNAATIELKNAIAADASNAQARWLLGSVYFRSGDLEGAAKELTRARELGVPPQDVLPLLAQALLPLGRYDEVLALQSKDFPPQAEATVLAAQGLAILAKGNRAEAAARADRALALSPQSAYARVAKARLLLVDGEVIAAREQLDQALASEPGHAPAWDLLGDVERQQRQLDRAEAAFSKALEVDPDNIEYRLKRALLRIDAKQPEQAQQDIDALRKRVPQHPGVLMAEGLLHLQKNELEEAKSAFEQAVRGGKAYPYAFFYLAAINAQQGNQAQAETYVSQFLELAPDSAFGRMLAAHLALRAGDFARAENLVRPVVAAYETDVAALNMLATALLAQGKTDEGLDLLARVTEIQPDSAAAQTRLAAQLIAAGQGEAGAEYLHRALELDPGFQQADVLLVLNQLRDKNLDGALEAAQTYRARKPDKPTPYNLLGRIHLAANDTAKAREAFGKALELAPGDPAASESLAALAVKDKDYETARRYYTGVLEKHPDYIRAHMQLAVLEMVQGNQDAMLERLRQMTKTYPEAAEPRVVLARYYLSQGRAGEALGLLNELPEAQKEFPPVLDGIAAVQLAQQDYASAKASLDRLLRLQPNVPMHHYQLAAAYAGLGEDARSRQELDEAIRLDPRHLPSRVALARMLLAQGEKEQFAAQVNELRQVQPDSPDVLLLEAALASQQGKDAEALAKLEQAYARAPTQATVQALAIAKLRRGDRAGSLKLLEDWVAKHPADTATRMVLADVYAADKRADDAMAQYKAVLESDPRNVIALNNLAWHLLAKDPEQALAYATRASGIAPESADVLDTLALAYLENKDLDKAEAQIAKAQQLARDNPTVRYHAALIRNVRGDKGGAILILKGLLGSTKDFPEKQEAAALLASLEK